MAAVNDVVQIRVTQAGQDQTLVNTFYYRVVSGSSPTVDDCLSEFKDTVWDAVRACQDSYLVTTNYTAINGMNNAEFEVEDVSTPGTSSEGGVALPIQNSLVLRSPSAGPGTRYSYRAFGGIMTGMLSSANGEWNGDYITTIEDVAVALGATLEGAVGAYVPVQITGSFILGTPPTVSRVVSGNWLFNGYPTGRRTRQNYFWNAVTP